MVPSLAIARRRARRCWRVQEVPVNPRIAYLVVAVLLLCLVGCTAADADGAPAVLLPGLMAVVEVVAEVVATVIEVMGIVIITKGAIAAGWSYVRDWFGSLEAVAACYGYRVQMGQAILLGLEFLVAADIIRTVAVRPTYRSVGILAAIVVIRTFLSFALEIEIEGRLPWKMHEE